MGVFVGALVMLGIDGVAWGVIGLILNHQAKLPAALSTPVSPIQNAFSLIAFLPFLAPLGLAPILIPAAYVWLGKWVALGMGIGLVLCLLLWPGQCLVDVIAIH